MTKKFAFVDCASIEDANKALQLDGVSFLGSKLRISSPLRYVAHRNKIDFVKTLENASGTRESTSVDRNNVSSISEKPTRILMLNNTLSFEDLDEDEDYMETVNDIKSECSQYGSLKRICVPRFGVHATKIFLEYRSVEDAVNAHNKLKNKTFDEKTMVVEFAEEEFLECL
jgi:RNA recognition motif-containing protein